MKKQNDPAKTKHYRVYSLKRTHTFLHSKEQWTGIKKY